MRYKIKQWFAGLLSIVMFLSLLPVTAMAEGAPAGESTPAAAEAIMALDGMAGANKPTTIAIEAAYNVTEGSVVINGDGECTITGTTESNTITVTGGNVKITLNGVSVTSSGCAFDIKGGDVTLILADETVNTFISGNYYAGIHVAESASLTIEGDGTLKAVSQKVDEVHPYEGTLGAGIGGNGDNGKTDEIETEDNAGSITITGGTIYATSEGDGAGIGGGWTFEDGKKHGQFQSITINDGTVYAESKRNGAGIGSGCWAEKMGTITITGGEIHAKTGADDHQSYDIGAGHGGQVGYQVGGEISITGGVVYTENRGIRIYNGELTLDNTIIFSSNGDGEVYGNATLDRNLTIESGHTLHIPEGSSLTVSKGRTLTVEDNATLENDGVLNNQGTVSGAGSVTGSGEFKGNPIDYYVSVTVPAFGSVREGYDQPEAQAITIQNKGKETVTISGVEVIGGGFTVEGADTTSIGVQLLPGDKYESCKIRPNAGLSGLHTATVTVTYDGGRKAEAEVSFMVHHFAAGEGTSESPYQIGDLAELEKFRDYVNEGKGDGEFFKLTADINLEGNEQNQWTPIGSYSKLFGGTFDGGGHTISGLYIDNSVRKYWTVGLFGEIDDNGTVKNLGVSGYIVGDDMTDAGGIAGANYGKITGCHSACTIQNGDNTGGIAGVNRGTVEDCYNTGEIHGDYAGGITGANYESAVTNCYNTGEIHGDYAGGITGANYESTVTNCYNTGEITGEVYVGGITGANDESTVTNCYNTGEITGEVYVGGITGENFEGTVTNCYNTGEIHGDDVGGITGENFEGIVTNCYYLKGTAENGIGYDYGYGYGDGEATPKTTDEFASGEVAYLLQTGQPSQIWGQTVGSGYPELTDSTEKTVYKVTFMTNSGEYAVKYANRDGVKELPLGPVVEGMVFDHWSADNFPNGEPFTASTTLTRDITVYAQGQSRFAGDVEDIEITETYGYTEQLTVNLDTHMHFEKEADVDSLFTYQLTNNGGVAGALIEVSTLTIPTGLNAGTYTLTVTASKAPPEFTLMSVGTYGTDPVTLTVKITISKANSKVETPPAGKTGLTYTGTEQELVTAGTATGGTMQYSLDGTTYSRSIPKGVEAGEYNVWYKVVGDENHNDSEPQSISVTIGKATPTVTVQAVTGTYGDDITLTAQVTAGDVAANLITGTIEFKDGDTTLGTADVVNGTATLTVLGSEREKQHALFGTDGSSTVSAAYTGNDNISNGDGNSAATVSQRTLEYDVTATGREYEPGKTEVDVSLIPKNLIKGDEVTLTATGNLSAADADTYESVSLTEITIGGTDKAYYTVANTADDVTLTSPVTISKADSKVETPPIAAEGLTYTGNPLSLLAGEAISNGGTMQYYVGKKDSTEQPDETADWKDNISDITAADAGTYTIWYRANGNNDYATSDLGSITVVIAKGESSVTKTPTPINRAYDGADHPLVEAGAAEGGTMQYSLEQNGKYSETIPNGQEAGEYTVWYKVVGDKNHNDSEPQSISVTIEKANGTGTLTMADFTCKEAGVEPKASSETNGPDAVITYALKGTEDFTNQKPETAGFYTVKAVFPANQNYNELTLTADFKITHQFNAGLEQREDGEYILCACGTGLLLETKKLNEVPEGLKQNPDVDTVEKIEQVLVEKVATGDHYVIYDVELEALIDGEWVIVTPENLPEDGVAITIPYPEGTSARYSFTVVHMFTTTGDGHVPGDTEILKVTNEPDGIHFTVKSLSPIAIGWKAGNLTVTVTNTGESADPAQQWQFRVELDDETISGEYGDMRFTDGVAEFTLISGQSLTARDLPEGVAYTVTELNGDQNGFTTTYTDDWGIITSEQDTVAAFINDKPAPVRPDDPADDPDDPADDPADDQPDTPSDNEPGDTPKTGDESYLTLWFSLMILSLIGITVIVVTSIIGRKKLVSANGRHMRK